MSILLDAVNRNKQQQSEVVDLLSTPATHYSSPSRPANKLKPYSLLTAAIVLGIGAAWGMSVLLVPQPAQPKIELPIQPETPLIVSQPVAKISQPKLNNHTETNSQANDEIRLAGKVALPIAKPFDQFFRSNSKSGYANTNNVSDSNAYDNNAYDSDVYANNRDANNTELTDVYSPPDTVELNANRQLQDQQQAFQQEQIILGANANRRGLAELEALRMQVNTAAQEVDFASVKAPSIDERNNLLAAFEVALKDVEFEQSINQQVTEPKLDPIPKSSNQQIPKYGDLPASVQLQVPEFTINAHVYSSEPNNRWLNVDGVELQQGDMIKNKLTIIEIRPRDIVLDINGEQFRVPAI